METQMTSREKSAYLDHVDELKKKKKKKKNKATGQEAEEKTTPHNGTGWTL